MFLNRSCDRANPGLWKLGTAPIKNKSLSVPYLCPSVLYLCPSVSSRIYVPPSRIYVPPSRIYVPLFVLMFLHSVFLSLRPVFMSLRPVIFVPPSRQLQSVARCGARSAVQTALPGVVDASLCATAVEDVKGQTGVRTEAHVWISSQSPFSWGSSVERPGSSRAPVRWPPLVKWKPRCSTGLSNTAAARTAASST